MNPGFLSSPLDRRAFLALAAGLGAGLLGRDGRGAATGVAPGTTEATPGPSLRRLHYRTDFGAPEIRVARAGGYDAFPLERVGPGEALASGFAPPGVAVRFHLADGLDGREDHPPGGGDYLLEADLEEGWLDAGVVLDVDPARLVIERIDAHTHPYARGQGDFVYDPTALLATVRPFGFALAVVSENNTLARQGEHLGALAADHPWLVPIAWIEPRRDTSDQARALLDAGFRGLKLHPSRSAYPADGPLLDPFLALCAERSLPIQIHSALDVHASPGRVLALARRHPRAPVVMVHTGLGQLDKTAILREMAPLANVYAETSWTNPESICQAMAVLDSSRTLCGTDATVDGEDTYTRPSIADPRGAYVYSYRDVLRLVRAWAHPAAHENWAWRTAARLYRPRFSRLVSAGPRCA